MGQKKINNYQLVNAGVMTGTAVITSAVQNVQNFDNIGFQTTWTGAAVGTIAIQFSVDNVNFVTVVPDYLSITQPNNNAGSYVFGFKSTPFPYMQFKYTNTSSTGVLNVFIFEKDTN